MTRISAFRKVRLVLAEFLAGDNPDKRREFVHEIEHNVDWNAKIFGFINRFLRFL